MLIGGNACYDVYETKDGKYISIGAIEPHLWANFCDHIGKPEFKGWQRNLNKQDEMFAFIGRLFKTKTRDEWTEDLAGVDACWSPVLELDEVFDDAQVRHRGMLFELDHPRLGKIPQIASPIKLSATPAKRDSAPPDLGEHTDMYLKELGYSADEIARLRSEGAV
jgi:crotonobetainyl-CoA:carnitine CoA-transferase CaiB-like acyl-CoA transferase